MDLKQAKGIERDVKVNEHGARELSPLQFWNSEVEIGEDLVEKHSSRVRKHLNMALASLARYFESL